MTEKYEMISKKEYTKPNPAGYVWLKQYILIKRGEKRFVKLRFLNDLGVRIDRLFFTVEQIGPNGSLLETTGSEHTVYVGLDAGISFEKELAVDDQCVAVAVRVDKVRSNGNEYSLENGQITAVMDADSMKHADISPEFLIQKDQKKGRDRRKLTVVAAAAILTVLIINLLIAFLHVIQ
ncbi:MAG: hypothetical protein IJW92_09120 [Clostridia bacterium]|nr:hypothetical protein [Clostridia bacterium]